jgi:hypothetical protein
MGQASSKLVSDKDMMSVLPHEQKTHQRYTGASDGTEDMDAEEPGLCVLRFCMRSTIMNASLDMRGGRCKDVNNAEVIAPVFSRRLAS